MNKTPTDNDDHNRASPDPISQLSRLHANQKSSLTSRFWKVVRRSIGLAGLVVLALIIYFWVIQRTETPETAIFEGVTYTCERLPETDEGSGLVYIVRVDLTAPGIELYTTPTDPRLTGNADRQYKLKTANAALSENDLAIVINGTQFSSDSRSFTWSGKPWPIRLSGDHAKSNEIVVSDHEVNESLRNNFLAWFDDDLVPHLESETRPTEEFLSSVKWGVGSQRILILQGEIQTGLSIEPDKRTAIGFDPDEKLLWLAVFENASIKKVASYLHDLGATDAVTLDGGSSCAMTIGPEARNIRSGNITGDWIPVATHFGVRAKPLDTND